MIRMALRLFLSVLEQQRVIQLQPALPKPAKHVFCRAYTVFLKENLKGAFHTGMHML